MRDCFSFNKFLSESDIWPSGRFFIGSARIAFLLISSAKSLSVQAFLTLVHRGGVFPRKANTTIHLITMRIYLPY
ncbi:conserved domain protein [Parasutterella excrementihominis YIT 11859]|uniref:Conserved domain protein n=1 Tax=Parasutterella excrementihominis YIT 11859 TaxID=762966 RepID=F3QKV2_9BURK|nr:conserved domain protein [Parasutterella excrementihominis YIT 11859]